MRTKGVAPLRYNTEMKEFLASPCYPVRSMRAWLALGLALLMGLTGCSTAPPDGITVVSPFDVNRYAGKWYEIARMDHSFERGLSEVSATYRLQPDGSVQVINRGFDTARQDWKEAVGKAVFTGDTHRGALKVSFFGPFYGGYHIVALDRENYSYAMISGPSRDYLWILARERQLPPTVRAALLQQAQALGFATEALIWVQQTRDDA